MHRPDPDALLAQIEEEEDTGAPHGRLKIFFGATAGVGKTYAMLEAAQARRREGIDVVVGVIETHGRRETQALLCGLELLPPKLDSHRGVDLREFDLDLALARRPTLILMDELAHTNAPGSRHAKRWQDVEELLGEGIDVYSTVNVQHLESLNDVVARVTHVKVRETVPDSVLERADEVELIDLPPEELLKRLEAGKVYIPEQAERAKQHFFKKGNLIALRQMALRRVADRVDAQMQVYRRAQGVAETWPVAERIVVGIGPSPSAQKLVRATKRMADRLGAEWIALFVETPKALALSREDRDRVWETLRLAGRLGGETATVAAPSAAELLAFARDRNASKIIVGKPTHPRWRDRVFGSWLDVIVRESGDIDIYVISGEQASEGGSPRSRTPPARQIGIWAWLQATVVVAGVTAIALPLRGRTVDLSNIVMLYLLAVGAIAHRLPRRIAAFTSILCVAAFDFFCVPPYYTFAVSDARFWPVFGTMLLAGLVISTLTARLRIQAEASQRVERRTAALLELTRDLGRASEPEDALAAAARHVAKAFGAEAILLLPDPFETLKLASASPGAAAPAASELAVGRWVYEHSLPAGLGTDTLPSARMLHVPLVTAGAAVGVLGICPSEADRFRDPEQLQRIEAFAHQIAAAVDRMRLSAESQRARHAIEVGRLKSEFVSTASQKLKKPIEELANALGPSALGPAAETLDKLKTLADDLLDLARLEAGRSEIAARAVTVEELLALRLEAVGAAAASRRISFDLDVAEGLPRVRADPERIATVVFNLAQHAIESTPPGGHVVMSADHVGDFVQIAISDDGPTVSLQDQARMFEPFVKLPGGRWSEGTGLRHAIARELVRAHGGVIWVDSGPGPGCVVSFTLPTAGETDPLSPMRVASDGDQPNGDQPNGDQPNGDQPNGD